MQPGSPPSLPTSGSFDFGTAGSTVESGYTQITPSTLYSTTSGYGWINTAGLDSRDRGTPDSLREDFVFSSTDHTFVVDLANGNYQVIVTIGDQNYAHDLIDVYAEGTLQINDLSPAAGAFPQITFYVAIADGQLNLGFHDDGGASPFWMINALTIQPQV